MPRRSPMQRPTGTSRRQAGRRRCPCRLHCLFRWRHGIRLFWRLSTPPLLRPATPAAAIGIWTVAPPLTWRRTPVTSILLTLSTPPTASPLVTVLLFLSLILDTHIFRLTPLLYPCLIFLFLLILLKILFPFVLLHVKIR